MDVVDALATVETQTGDKPVEDVVMKTITVELNGYELTEPETIQ
jgi:peptidyl-prolyl cis-trans isomerase B (cyclophilin B)